MTSWALGGVIAELQRRQVGEQADGGHRLVGRARGRRLQRVGGVDLGLELDRLLRRSLQPQRLEPVAGLGPDPLRDAGCG